MIGAAGAAAENAGGTGAVPAGAGAEDQWTDGADGLPNGANTAAWREREQRQRTVRTLMMFLLVLLLMDGDEEQNRRQQNGTGIRASSKKKNGNARLSSTVWNARTEQDFSIHAAAREDSRYSDLATMNNGKVELQKDVFSWAANKDAFERIPKEEEHKSNAPTITEDSEVFHYPWNATGFYRGEWTRKVDPKDALNEGASSGDDDNDEEESTSSNDAISKLQYKTPEEMESLMQSRLLKETEQVGVFLLPPNYKLKTGGANFNATKMELEEKAHIATMTKAHVSRKEMGSSFLSNLLLAQEEQSVIEDIDDKEREFLQLRLNKLSGRIGLQFYARSIPAMKEISLIDGFVKLYDSNTLGYSTRKDILLRVKGVIVHSIGRISLVANMVSGRSALVIAKHNAKQRVIKEDELGINAKNNAKPGVTNEDEPRFSNYSDDDDISYEEESKIQGSTQHGTLEREDDWSVPDKTKEKMEDVTRKRRLTEALSNLADRPDAAVVSLDQIRKDTMALWSFDATTEDADEVIADDSLEMDYSSFAQNELREKLGSVFSGIDTYRKEKRRRRLSSSTADTPLEEGEANIQISTEKGRNDNEKHALVVEEEGIDDGEKKPKSSDIKSKQHSQENKANVTEVTYRRATSDEEFTTPTNVEDSNKQRKILPEGLSQVVFPVPFVTDDKKESIRKEKTPATKKIPARDTPLEANAGRCEFELNFNVKAEGWTLREWRNLVYRHVHETNLLEPTTIPPVDETESDKKTQQETKEVTHPSISTRKAIRDQALVMDIIGTVHSPNCHFTAGVNATAVRTNWESTTGKAINYSFYMMLTCLCQIMVLLRQLLHSQAQSAAMRVSLMTVGWQTVLDALLCLGHISLSLAMQPLFTAFASVAFFKLLIFCVIEMKYMAIIIQARNTGENTAEILRRQVTMLHLRFYVGLMGVLIAFFYTGEKYRTLYMLCLYSFWVPQIVLNVITEAKRPLHHYYIYGMSITRLVAPLYIFSVPNNFLTEVYPQSPYNPQMCQLLVLWIGIQTAIMIAQGKYGARFMISARFLPPKFDYSRPIPDSLLPPGVSRTSSFESEESVPIEVEVKPLIPGTEKTKSDRHATSTATTKNSDRHATTTRNRITGNRTSTSPAPTTEEPVVVPEQDCSQTLDCVICYNSIDIHNRRGYMLGPCDHIFHRDCLMQWMDVKMECPICRTELPAL